MTRYRAVAVAPELAFQWMAERGDGLVLTPDFTALGALDSSDNIHGIVAYSHATSSSVQFHMVLESPIAFRTLREAALPVLFEVLDKKFALAQVRASNKRARKLLERYGFHQVVFLHGGYKDGADDLIIYRLDREKWVAENGR